MFAVITLQQVCDKEENATIIGEEIAQETGSDNNKKEDSDDNASREKQPDENCGEDSEQTNENPDRSNTEGTSDDCNVCNESRIYNVFKNLREKFSFSENL